MNIYRKKTHRFAAMRFLTNSNLISCEKCYDEVVYLTSAPRAL